MGDNHTYVGLDVAKHHLDICVLPRGEIFRVATDEAGLMELRARLQGLAPALIVLEATGRLAKTDRLDAEILARFAQTLRPEPRPLPDAVSRTLRELVARRRQLIGLRTAEAQRLGQVGQGGAGGLYAQAARRAQRHAAGWRALAARLTAPDAVASAAHAADRCRAQKQPEVASFWREVAALLSKKN